MQTLPLSSLDANQEDADERLHPFLRSITRYGGGMETLAHTSNRRIHPPSRSAPCGGCNHWHARQLQRLDGEGKSQEDLQRLCLVAAALINGQVLEYRASFPETKRNILYFDTEQSPYHCQLVMQRILHLAGLPLDREPQYLHFSHLRAIAEPEIRRAIIRYAIYHTPDVGLVIIDGIRDLMHDINSSTEATKLVGDLMQWTGEQNIHIQTVLHLNKGDDNARGHIGTELNNKAESVLLIARDNADADRSIVSPRADA